MMIFLKLFRTHWVHILLITFIGAILRFWGITHGLREGFTCHADTGYIIGDIWKLYLGDNYTNITYSGPVYNTLVTFSMQFGELLGRFIAYPPEWTFESIATVGSIVSAILGTATILLVYLLGRLAYTKNAGILGAIFFSVCPLQSFHSHYPYRDVPMVFFLVLTLVLCIQLTQKMTSYYLAIAAFLSILTASIKPAGMVVAAPLVVSSIIGIFKIKTWGKRIGFFIFITIIFMGAFLIFTKTNERFTNINAISSYFDYYKAFFKGAIKAFIIIHSWINISIISALILGISYAIWRHRVSDAVLCLFVLSGFFAAAIFPYLDERFLILLFPVSYLLLGRVISEFWERSDRKILLKIFIGVAAAGIISISFSQSAWQGVMLTLPDTRALSGKWLDAHIPNTLRIAMEGYSPLGLVDSEKWPLVFPVDGKTTPDYQKVKPDILITSSLEHQRYIDFPDSYPEGHKIASFFSALPRERQIIKKIEIDPVGFAHSTIQIYSNQPPRTQALKIPFPRPYDAKWNFGVSFLENGPYDRDDRSIELGWGHRYSGSLVSKKKVDEIVVFMLNGPEPSRVAVKVGWKRKIRNLTPGELHVLKFRPKWFFPKRPALYRFEAALPVGKKVFVQLRCGNREIGEAFAKWGLYDKALPYLKRALTDDPFDSESQFLLAIIEKKLGQSNQAKQTLKGLTEKNYQYIQMVLSLGQSGFPVGKWEQLFRDYTKLTPSLLTYALSQEFNTDKAFPSRSGEIKKDCQASGGQVIVFDRSIRKPDEVMHGPYLYLDQGAYRAGFFLRTWNVKGADSFAVIKVLADDHVISMQSISAEDLKNSDKPFKKAEIPFINANPRAEIKFQVFATGSASFAVDRVRIEPDLRKTFEEKLSQLKYISK